MAAAAGGGITGSRWPAPIRRLRRLNFRPLHIVMISALIDGAGVRGAPLEINLQLGRCAEIRRYVSRAMQSRFSEDLTTRPGPARWISARRPEQYFLINTSKAIDATSAEYIISSPAVALSRRDVIVPSAAADPLTILDPYYRCTTSV